MRYMIIIVLALQSIWVQAQSDSIPTLILNRKFIQASAGEVVSFEIGKTSATGQIKMDNAPSGAFIDSTTFTWIVPKNLEGQNKIVDFSLVDNGVLLDKNSVFISIETETNPPRLSIESNIPNEKGIYHLTPGSPLKLSILAESQLSSRQDKVHFDYYFNEDKNYKSLENASIDIKKNTLELNWTPSLAQLDDKYINFTVLVVDEEHQMSEKNILFILNRKNQPPYYIYPVMDEYYISPNEALNIDFAARDPEGDSLLYHLDIQTKIGNPRLTGEGKFSWKLNKDQIMRLRNQFPLEITIEATEISPESPQTIIQRFKVNKNIANQPPKILNLQNERIPEGLEYQKTVFIQDPNDESNDLEIEIRGAPKEMEWTFIDNMLQIHWTPGFDVVGVEMKPEKFDMLLVVKDPIGYVDQKAFTITVEHREDTELTYESYSKYKNDAVKMVDVLSVINHEMQDRETRVKNFKKALSITSMFSATYTAIGNVYQEDSRAQKMIPYVGAVAVIAGGINAFGFNDLSKYGDLREKSYVLDQKLRYMLGVLGEYRIDGPNSPNLENAEFRDKLRSFEQSMINDKLDFKRYHAKYLSLNYIKRQQRKKEKSTNRYTRNSQDIYFMNMDKF